jgi:LPXTG-motif cell wall-anchored protein
MLRKMLIGAVMLVALAAAPAAAQYNPTVVNPGNVEAGGQVTVTGEGCVPFEEITITIRPYSAEQDPTRKAPTKAPGPLTDPGPQGYGDPILTTTVTADAEGKFSVTLTIPPGTAPGQYVVESTSDCVQSAIIDVVPPPTTPPPGQGGGNLGRTGSDLDKLGMAGAGLLVLGGIVLVATKRRRHEAATPAI